MEEQEPLKDNNCAMFFACVSAIDCVYFAKSTNSKTICKWRSENSACKSATAQVNRMTLHLKHIGLKIS